MASHFTRTGFLAALLLGGTALSSAADLPSRKAPLIAPPPVFTWSGFYVGGQVGYLGLGNEVRTHVSPLATLGAGGIPGPEGIVGTNTSRSGGVVGGLHAGMNWQWGRVVFGTESDIEITSARTSGAFPGVLVAAGLPPAGIGTITAKNDWRGSSRLRFGVAFDRLLLYATGGVAYGQFHLNHLYNAQFFGLAAAAVAPTTENYSTFRTGGTIGAGIEYALWDAWSIRGEYRYSDFGRYTRILSGFPIGYAIDHRLTDHSGRLALSYHFGGSGPAASFANSIFPPIPGSYDWTGVKVGVQAGYGWDTDRNSTFLPILPFVVGVPFISNAQLGSSKASPSGFVGGVHAGWDWQTGRIVSGAEVDFEGSSIRGSAPVLGVNFATGALGVPVGTATTRSDWRGSARGRFGIAFDRWLPYVTAGFAFADYRFSNSYLDALGPAADSVSRIRMGSTYGVGLEYAFAPDWSVRAEYRYTDFGKLKQVLPGSPAGYVQEHKIDDHVVRAGVTYRFGGPIVAPVVAKY